MSLIETVDLVIFDCDGVVADSEPLAIRVLQESLAARGVGLSVDEVSERFLGRSAETVARLLKVEFDLVFDDAEQTAMRERLLAALRTDLTAVAGVEALLRDLPVPFCLASSSPMERIMTSLQTIALADHFEGRIFNAAMVVHGKPAPDLFLHAARTMGVIPERCVVIEDSPVGIEAGKRAGMQVIGFLGGDHARNAAHRAGVKAAAPHHIAETMEDVAGLLGGMPGDGVSKRQVGV
jgi:HAD superfamily hydrolase (TIGR01509 family)